MFIESNVIGTVSSQSRDLHGGEWISSGCETIMSSMQQQHSGLNVPSPPLPFQMCAN